MQPDRREFIERLTAGAAAVAGLSLARSDVAAAALAPAQEQAEKWDLSWMDRVTGKYRAVFDATAIEDGAGFLRAMLWKGQYSQVLGAGPGDLSAVFVARHEAIPLVMTQAYWDRYGVAKKNKVKHPFTDKATTFNPALLPASELPPPLASFTLDGFLQGGGIILGCNLAFGDIVRTVAKEEKLSEADARKQALGMLQPGVILQPSGVFATIRAQDAGCRYLKAS
jgi:hypothetical protein